MNELVGCLSAFIPEFEPSWAMMQFNDCTHSYTVDEHTIHMHHNLDPELKRAELEEDILARRLVDPQGMV